MKIITVILTMIMIIIIIKIIIIIIIITITIIISQRRSGVQLSEMYSGPLPTTTFYVTIVNSVAKSSIIHVVGASG